MPPEQPLTPNQPDQPEAPLGQQYPPPLTPFSPSLQEQVSDTPPAQPLPTPAQPQAYQAAPPAQPLPQEQPPTEYAPPAPIYPAPAPVPRKSGKRLVGIIVATAAIILLIGAGLFAYKQSQPTPDKVFKAAVENSLSTEQVKQVTSLNKTSQELLYDVSSSNDPRVYSHAQTAGADLAINFEQYTSLKDTFVKYHAFGAVFDKNTKYKDKWMQERKNGKSTSGDVTLEGLLGPDAYTYFFGDWIFGNFQPKDKADLTNYIVGQKVFKYDASKVTKQKLGANEVYVYKVNDDAAKKLTMNKKVAAIWGVDQSKLETDLNGLPQVTSATMYVDIKTKRLVQVETTSSSDKWTTKYADYNTVKVPAQPVIEASYADFIKVFEATPL